MHVKARKLVTIQIYGKLARLFSHSGGSKPFRELQLSTPSDKPFLKWAGGKQWFAPLVQHIIPEDFCGTYYEPFLGGGSVFFAINPSKAVLSDSNSDLIMTYKAIRKDVSRVIRALKRHYYDEEYYYEIRDQVPRTMHTMAARIIYLNRSCWNGLFRVNAEGRFNVPFGRFSNPTICDADRLRFAARRLKSAKLRTDDFAAVVSAAEEGDLVYFDPPYVTGHTNNGFLRYNARLFSWMEQIRLGQVAVALAQRGVHVLVSNASDRRILRLYKGFNHFRIIRSSMIGASLESRGPKAEALLSSYPLLDIHSEVI